MSQFRDTFNKVLQTHRCELSLKHHISIRYMSERAWGSGGVYYRSPNWVLGHVTSDSEDLWCLYWEKVCRVYYCPFCGVKLEETGEGEK